MAFFRHTKDNYIIINNGGNNLIMPLSFFITQEASYAIPAGATWQEYLQGTEYYSSDGITSTNYSIPWTDGNTYISNFSTYETNYNAYLAAQALPQTLEDAKIYQINLLKQYANSDIKNAGVISGGIIYQSYEGFYDQWKIAYDYSVRNSALLSSYYVHDISHNEIIMPSIAVFTELFDCLDEFYWEIRQVEDNHKDAINALGTINDVLTYDYTTNYPIVPYDADLTFFVSYATSIDADYAGGSVTGTATGGAAVVSGWLDLAHDDARYVSYDGTSNVDNQQIGSILIEAIKPNYSATPASDQVFLSISKADADSTNLIQLTHKATTGNLQLDIKDSLDVSVASINFGAWSPTSATEYKISIHYDITSGDTWIRIDDDQFGSTDTSTGTRDANIDLLRIGSGYNSGSAETSNFSIKRIHFSSK